LMISCKTREKTTGQVEPQAGGGERYRGRTWGKQPVKDAVTR
jgi:hypothetical protein